MPSETVGMLATTQADLCSMCKAMRCPGGWLVLIKAAPAEPPPADGDPANAHASMPLATVILVHCELGWVAAGWPKGSMSAVLQDSAYLVPI